MTEKDTNLPPKKRKVSENTGLDRTEPKSASENVKSVGGRPTLYKEEYNEQARKLCLLGSTDEELAFFFDTDFVGLAEWAKEYPKFLAAISISEEEIEAHSAARKAKRILANERKKKSRTASGRIRAAASARMWAALKAQGMSKDAKFFSRLGYSLDELISHLVSQFSSGMTLDNYGQWHVDHIKPCSLFDLSEPTQFDECWALSNLQPLWAADNIKKGASYAST